MTTPSEVHTPLPELMGKLPESGVHAAKRVHVIPHDPDPNREWDWWVGHGKDESCQIEGTPNHWHWLAYLIIGLADQKDAPYSEDKPLPIAPSDVVTAVNERPKLLERVRVLEEALIATRRELGHCAAQLVSSKWNVPENGSVMRAIRQADEALKAE